jgi:GNAT superfamily N-acetyltransferase
LGPPDGSLERIHPDHDLAPFTCGVQELDLWLHAHAQRSDASDSARVFVYVESGRVVGYFALTMGSVARMNAPRRLVRGLPGYPVAAVLIARFAIDSSVQHRGYGARLLALAIANAYRAGESVAARLLMVDAIDENAASFYMKFGFAGLPEHPLRLFVRLKDIAKTLEA